MRRTVRIALCLALASSTAFASGRPSTSIPPVNQPIVGPQAALERYAEAFRARSPDGIAAVLTSDYRFHTVGDSLSLYWQGSDRVTEMRVVRNLLLGIIRDGVTVVPPPDSVGIYFDGFADGIDPEHPDSTQHYRSVTVNRAEFGIRLANGDHLLNAPTTHVFQVVRGDAAVLEPGQSPSPEHWYIRRWLEDVSGVRKALDHRQGACGDEPAPATEAGAAEAGAAAPHTPAMLSVRP